SLLKSPESTCCYTFSLHDALPIFSLQWALGGAVLLTFFTPTGALVTVASFLLLPYAVLALAFAKDPAFAGFSRFGDYSYGIYLRSEEHTSELQSREKIVCRLLP